MVIATVSAYFLISFNNRLIKLILTIIDLGAGGLISIFHFAYNITDKNMRLWSTTIFYISYIVFLLLALYGICHLIKDKNDKDLLRIRDILLGQQDYIIKYYEMRKAQIDEKLQIVLLEEREKKIKIREDALLEEKCYLERNKEVLHKQGKKRLKIVLPDRKEIFLNQSFIDTMPSFFDGFANCLSAIDQYTTKDISNTGERLNGEIKDNYKEVFEAFLMNIETNILSSLFGNSSQVRVHFRYYNIETKSFDMISAITGKRGKPFLINHMSPIPYEESLIKKSFECKRAIIRSINPSATVYNGANSTTWQDYMTYTFYNICYENVPCLSFGISVQNTENYRDIFYFLNYAKFEMYLNGCVERFNENISIISILYN
ncbi:MAG: hypothetical protein E7302_00810 [Butyrivibrio sp.]|nr:hypothetical protein [Butyrivibrio sp.]